MPHGAEPKLLVFYASSVPQRDERPAFEMLHRASDVPDSPSASYPPSISIGPGGELQLIGVVGRGLLHLYLCGEKAHELKPSGDGALLKLQQPLRLRGSDLYFLEWARS
mmetsp:Transcript_27765/g.84753  ORF Transcript_27765/g.84753 Transcript_27765/m.84753 type:complete len:109 (-) Transcript_27765:300-626(-)